MVRLLIQDVTLIEAANGLTAHVRFRGGATTTLTLAKARNAWQLRETGAEILALIDQLLDQHTDGTIATILNARGYLSGTGQPFQRVIVQHIRHRHGLRSRYARLRARGMLTRDEIADRLKVSAGTVKIWGRHGLLGRRLADRRRPNVLPDQTNEVQYDERTSPRGPAARQPHPEQPVPPGERDSLRASPFQHLELVT